MLYYYLFKNSGDNIYLYLFVYAKQNSRMVLKKLITMFWRILINIISLPLKNSYTPVKSSPA